MKWWILAAAAVIVASVLSIPLVRHFFQATYPGAIVETAGDSSYRAGETVAGTPIHSGAFEPLSLRLEDGTRVEMRGQSELELESANDGVRVRLNSGSILVTAANAALAGTFMWKRRTPSCPLWEPSSLSRELRWARESASAKAKSRWHARD